MSVLHGFWEMLLFHVGNALHGQWWSLIPVVLCLLILFLIGILLAGAVAWSVLFVDVVGRPYWKGTFAVAGKTFTPAHSVPTMAGTVPISLWIPDVWKVTFRRDEHTATLEVSEAQYDLLTDGMSCVVAFRTGRFLRGFRPYAVLSPRA